MELATKNELYSEIDKTASTATTTGATAGMPATVSGEMWVCQRSGRHGRRQWDICISQGRLGEDSQGQGRAQRTLPRHRLKIATPPADGVSSLVLAHYGQSRC